MENASLTSTAPDEEWAPTVNQKVLAWMTHGFTASGALWGFLSILAINDGHWRFAFFWMAAAVFVDSFDGFIARATRVKKVLPGFDGALLDNIVDYLNYVFVPAYFLYQAPLLPPSMRIVVPCAVLLASAYQFCQSDAKTDDHYFKGFPSYWNIIVYYMVIGRVAPWLNVCLILLLVVMVFVPIKYIYPSRTSLLPGLTMALGMLWGVTSIAILIQFPHHAPILVWLSLLYAIYYGGLSIYATVKQRAG